MGDRIKRFLHHVLAVGGFTIVRSPRAFRSTPSSQLDVSFDMVLCEYLLRRKESPSFVQVGAFNGVDGDPLHEYVQRGLLKGCLIEPQADYFEQLRSNYAGIDGLVFKRAAVGKAPGEASLYRVRPGTPGPEWLFQIASFRREVLMRHAPCVPGLEAAIVTETVPVITFGGLFAELNARPDIVVIDTEGYDYETVKNLLAADCRPDIIMYEHKHLIEPDKNACIRLLIGAGYKLAVGDIDTIAILPESQDSRAGAAELAHAAG